MQVNITTMIFRVNLMQQHVELLVATTMVVGGDAGA
jgi:hypothetical protein